MKRGDGKSQRRGKKRRSKKRKSQKKKIQVREKVGKSRNTVFFQWFVALEGGKVGSLKRRVRSHLAKWGMKSCTPLWREAHFQVKMYKTPQPRSTFRSWDVEKVRAAVARSTFPSQYVGALLEVVVAQSTFRSQNAQNTPCSDHFCWDVEKVHAVVARSTFRSQNVQNTPCSDHFWKLTCRKSARRCGAEHISKSKVEKTEGYGALLDVQMSFSVAGAGDCAPCQKWAKREGFVALSKTMAGAGHWKDAFRMASAVQETCSWEMLGGQGGDFLRGLHFGAWDLQVWEDDFAWQVQHFVWPGFTFSGQAQYFRDTTGKIAKRIGTRPSALHSTFHFSRMSRRIASFLMLSSLKIEEVSQNCFVLDVVKFKNWRSLAE